MILIKSSIAALSIITILATTAHAKHLHHEAEYRDAWCRGETEARLPNGNRADCITKNYAVEVASKYHEAIGQALDYADQTGKRPAILMIIETPNDWRYYNKLKPLARKEHIKVWYTTPSKLQHP